MYPNTIFHYHKDLKPFTASRLKYLREQVSRLKKIKLPEQRSKEWFEMRENKITASDIATALDESKYQRDYVLLKKKVTKDRKFISNKAMEWGVKYEEIAVKIYEYRNSMKVLEYGCIQSHYKASDGITDDGIMLEIKCPSSRKITGIIPSYYWCQVQTQLEVCELDRCDFLECKLEEYKNRDEYESDIFENNKFYNSLGMEKGVIVEYFNKVSKKLTFDYSELGIMGDDIDTFIKNSKDSRKSNSDLIYSTVCYWKLVQISCIPIYRNQEWFNEKLPTLKEFWNDVEKYRKLSLKELEKYIEIKKKRKKKEVNKYKDTKISSYYSLVNDDKKDKKLDNIFCDLG